MGTTTCILHLPLKFFLLRLAEETKLCEAKEEEAVKLLQLLKEKQEEERVLKERLDVKRKHHVFLVSDALSQYEQLKETNETMRQHQNHVESELSTYKNQLESLLSGHANNTGSEGRTLADNNVDTSVAGHDTDTHSSPAEAS